MNYHVPPMSRRQDAWCEEVVTEYLAERMLDSLIAGENGARIAMPIFESIGPVRRRRLRKLTVGELLAGVTE